MKYFFILAFIGILGALGSAGFFLMKDTKDSAAGKKRMAWALTWRIGLSVALFILVWVMYLMGWIQPTGLPVGAMQ